MRLDETFDSGDADLLSHYRRLAAEHLEVLAGDKGESDLGLDRMTWQRLADTVDLIVDPAALVNHVLPYDQLFGPNVVGTAELIRLALTTKLKPFVYLSTVGVGDQIEPARFVEDADVRQMSATRKVNDSYANGYGNSKWAGEVLLREAHDLSGLPVSVFRCDMILAEPRYAGQLNVPDMFTRLLLSLVATGIAPGSFYELDAAGNRQRAHYDGLPVDFIAEAISTLGAHQEYGFETYHVMNPYDDGIGLDEYVDWLIDAGYRSTASRTTGNGCSGSRRACEPFRTDSARLPCCRCCTATRSLPSRFAARSPRPTVSAPRCRKRKSARTKTSRMSRRRSSSSTSPTCSCSACCKRFSECEAAAKNRPDSRSGFTLGAGAPRRYIASPTPSSTIAISGRIPWVIAARALSGDDSSSTSAAASMDPVPAKMSASPTP